jgi:hypothetical protein
MRPLFSIFVLVIAGALAFGTGCAEDSDLFGTGGKKGGDTTEPTPTPSPSPSGTGGKVIND